MGLHHLTETAWMNGSGKQSNTVTAHAGITAAGESETCAARAICRYMPQGEQSISHIAKQRNTQLKP
jgi:hypothetical protein